MYTEIWYQLQTDLFDVSRDDHSVHERKPSAF
jgi:hypothetical protein